MVLFGEMSSEKIKLFGHNDHIWRKKGEACKPKNTMNMLLGCFSAGGTGALHKIDCIMWSCENLCGYIEATSQDISQEVKAGSQMGLPNGQ